jgi:uncharacterized protein (DUF433 family)
VSENNVLRAFSAEHVMKLTGLSVGQLRNWDATGFFAPAFSFEGGRGRPYSRVYDFQDVVGLRVLSVLRHDYKIPMKHLREVAEELEKYSNAPWAELKLYVLGKEVHFHEPETEKPRGVISKQYAIVEVIHVVEGLRREAEKLTRRDPQDVGQVERHRYVAHNAWVVAGTRIPIRIIRRFSEAGYSPAQIVLEYPSLTEQDVIAVLEHSEKLTA